MTQIEAVARLMAGDVATDGIDHRDEHIFWRLLTVVGVWCLIPIAIPIAVVAVTVKAIYNALLAGVVAAGAVVAINFGDRE